jgi:pimeloyl-ACP methyl ester carboxylesterase
MKIFAGVTLAIFGLVIVVALGLTLTPMEYQSNGDDVFGFDNSVAVETSPPPVVRFVARDKRELAYRFYPSSSDRILLFIHGSSYHGAAYHGLAQAISDAGKAKVYLPNLRGHYLSGIRRGDVDYLGQLEDDLADLIAHARAAGHEGEVIVGGHSSGAGLAIRFAGGEHRSLADGYLLLSPVIPVAPSVRNGDAGGWAILNEKRLTGLLVLNAFGISGMNGLPVIEFNKPEKYWDGTETLSYSFRLNQSYHPRYNYEGDIQGMGDEVVVLVGEYDEAVDPEALQAVFKDAGSNAIVHVLSDTNHFGIFGDKKAHQMIVDSLD